MTTARKLSLAAALSLAPMASFAGQIAPPATHTTDLWLEVLLERRLSDREIATAGSELLGSDLTGADVRNLRRAVSRSPADGRPLIDLDQIDRLVRQKGIDRARAASALVDLGVDEEDLRRSLAEIGLDLDTLTLSDLESVDWSTVDPSWLEEVLGLPTPMAGSKLQAEFERSLGRRWAAREWEHLVEGMRQLGRDRAPRAGVDQPLPVHAGRIGARGEIMMAGVWSDNPARLPDPGRKAVLGLQLDNPTEASAESMVGARLEGDVEVATEGFATFGMKAGIAQVRYAETDRVEGIVNPSIRMRGEHLSFSVGPMASFAFENGNPSDFEYGARAELRASVSGLTGFVRGQGGWRQDVLEHGFEASALDSVGGKAEVGVLYELPVMAARVWTTGALSGRDYDGLEMDWAGARARVGFDLEVYRGVRLDASASLGAERRAGYHVRVLPHEDVYSRGAEVGITVPLGHSSARVHASVDEGESDLGVWESRSIYAGVSWGVAF